MLPKPFDLLLLGLHLPVPRKRMNRIGAEFLHPFAQHVLIEVEIAGRLCHRDASFPDKLHRLKLELATEFPSDYQLSDQGSLALAVSTS